MSRDPRCPHLLFRDVLGPDTVGALLDYVVARQDDFIVAPVRNRQSGRQRIDRTVRDCSYLVEADVGTFKIPIRAFLDRIAPRALLQLGLLEPKVEPREFEISAYGDHGHFASHVDTLERLDQVRILSCVYYFASTPRRFNGGTLRLHGFPTFSAKSGLEPPAVDIIPETDSLVVFPSWLRHEVLPVEVPSGAWADGRFTINCWIHRVNPPTDAAPTAS